MSTNDDLILLLKKLRLSGILQTLELRTRQLVDDNLSQGEFFYRLDQRLRRASFEKPKTLEEFDFVFNPRILKAKNIDLATCSFIEHQENMLLIGPTGTGSRTWRRRSTSAPVVPVSPCCTWRRRIYSSSYVPRAPTAATSAGCCVSPRRTC